MDFAMNETQSALQKDASEWLEANFSNQLMREAEQSSAGFAQNIWKGAVALGWAGMTVRAEFGGWGSSLLDASILLEEIGRAGLTLPLVASSVLSAGILQRLPQSTLRDRALKDIASGKIVAPALIDESGRNEWDAVTLPLLGSGDTLSISGAKILVPFGSSAEGLLVSGRNDAGETVLLMIDPQAEGVSITPHQSGVGVPVASVAMNNVQIAGEDVLAAGEGAQAALHAGLHIASLLASAEAVGLSQSITKLATEYVAQREAFGQPIGAFQAVAHPCADMHISNETIRLLVHQAAWLHDSGKDAVEEMASTKALANELFERVANDAFCFHGAAGFAEEVDLQLFMRRIRYFCQAYGETHEALERAADAADI